MHCSFKKLVTKRPVQQVAPVAPPTSETGHQSKSPSPLKKKEGTSPLLHLKKGKLYPLYVSRSDFGRSKSDLDLNCYNIGSGNSIKTEDVKNL